MITDFVINRASFCRLFIRGLLVGLLSLPLQNLNADYTQDFEKANNAVNDFRKEYFNIKFVDAEEARKIVSAIAEADEDERKEAGQQAGARAKATVDSNRTQLNQLKATAVQAIKTARQSLENLKGNEQEYKAKASELDKLETDLDAKASSLDKILQGGARGTNHPVIGWMVEAGNAAHADRQRSLPVREFSVGSAGRIDGLTVDGSVLVVVELKPCNSKAINQGQRQLDKYIRELKSNWKSNYRDELTKQNNAFGSASEIEGRIDCYGLNPIINETGDYEKAYVRWSEGKARVSKSALP
jgi:hypothetical protein